MKKRKNNTKDIFMPTVELTYKNLEVKKDGRQQIQNR